MGSVVQLTLHAQYSFTVYMSPHHLPYCPVRSREPSCVKRWSRKAVCLTGVPQSSEPDYTAGDACHWLVCPVLLVAAPSTVRHQTILLSRFHHATDCHIERVSLFLDRGVRYEPNSHAAPQHVALRLNSHLLVVLRLAFKHMMSLLDVIQVIQHKVWGFCIWATKPVHRQREAEDTGVGNEIIA